MICQASPATTASFPKPTTFAGVSTGINELINHWLETKSSQFSIAANTQFKKNILYNESEMALQFGVDVSYLKGKLGIDFEAITIKDYLKTKNLNKRINCSVIMVSGKPLFINGSLSEDNILDQVNELIQFT